MLVRKSIIIAICYMIMQWSCKDSIKSFQKFTLFEPNYSVTYNQLLESGFSNVEGVDVLMVRKQLNDTTVLTFYIEDSIYVSREVWTIRFKEFSKEDVRQFMFSNKASIVTSFCEEYDPIEDSAPSYEFFVLSKFSRLYFHCDFWNASGIDEVWLEIAHEYPYYYREGNKQAGKKQRALESNCESC